MRMIYLDEPFSLSEKTVVCLGFFDGVHIGHRRLIEKAKQIARIKGDAVCVHTFAQMPAKLLCPERKTLELTPLPEKAALLFAAGVDIVAVSQFDEAMMRMRAEDFFRGILQEKLHAEHIVAGFHHRFGRGGEMDAQSLAALCERTGVGFSRIEPVTLSDGSVVSSTAIRACIQSGNCLRAEEMLGRDIVCRQGRHGE